MSLRVARSLILGIQRKKIVMADVENMKENEVTVNVGPSDLVKIQKMYGPTVFADIKIAIDLERCEWVVYRRYGYEDVRLWVEVARIPGQLDTDFHPDLREL